MTQKSLSELYRAELYRALLKPPTPLSAVMPSQPRAPMLADLLSAPPPTALWAPSLFKSPTPGTSAPVPWMLSASPTARANTLASLLEPPDPVNILGGWAFARQPPSQWIAVRPRFTEFHKSLTLTELQLADGRRKSAGVVSCLNRAYYASNSETGNSFLVGSWGKNTATRPPRDVDVYFLLPPQVFHRFQPRLGNRQSALLQEVKEQLALTYPGTDMSGDGQVVVVKFDSYCLEAVPAFALTTPGRYWICDTHDGGAYKETSPWAEIAQLDAADLANARNLRPLICMLKAWQIWCSVPIKSFHLELIATEFIGNSPWRLKDFFWFDWLTRDFFEFLCQHVNGQVIVPGTCEVMSLGDEWHSRALAAYQRAIKACEYERDNQVEAAGEEWQKIFGLGIPRTI